MTDTVFCESCGASIAATASYCTSCGNAQTAVSIKQSDPGDAQVPCPNCGARAARDGWCEICGENLRPEILHRYSRTAAEQRTHWLASHHPIATQPVSTPEPVDRGTVITPSEQPPPSSQSREAERRGDRAPMRPLAAGTPVELWLVVGAFALPGAWIAFNMLKALPDALRALGSQFYGFRIGLAFTLIIVLIGLVGVGMLIIAWRLYQRDRVGRGLAYVVAGTIVVSVAGSGGGGAANTVALLCSVAGICILAFSPRVSELFDESTIPGAAPTSVIVSRVAIAIFSAIGALTSLTYLLLGSVSGKYVLVAVLIAAGAVLASTRSGRLMQADRTARQQLTIGGAALFILMIALGQSAIGLLVPLGLIAATLAALWLPNDARGFFGDTPLGGAPSK